MFCQDKKENTEMHLRGNLKNVCRPLYLEEFFSRK